VSEVEEVLSVRFWRLGARSLVLQQSELLEVCVQPLASTVGLDRSSVDLNE